MLWYAIPMHCTSGDTYSAACQKAHIFAASSCFPQGVISARRAPSRQHHSDDEAAGVRRGDAEAAGVRRSDAEAPIDRRPSAVARSRFLVN